MKLASGLLAGACSWAMSLALCPSAAAQLSCTQILAAVESFPSDDGFVLVQHADLEGPWCAGGMPRARGNRGAVALWQQDLNGLWQYRQELVLPNSSTSTGFGMDPNFHGNRLLVGSQGPFGSDRVARIYRLAGDQWVGQATLVPGDSDGGSFGWSTALLDSWAFVGAPGDNAGGSGAGAVYVFQRQGNQWTQVQKLVAPVALPGEGFGGLVEASGDILVVANLTGGVLTGNDDAYVFRLSGGTWGFEQSLIGADTQADHFFGQAIAIQGNTIAIGAPRVQGAGPASPRIGAVYLFEYEAGTWQETQSVRFNEGQRMFGFEVEFDEGRLVATSTGTDAFTTVVNTHFLESTANGWVRIGDFRGAISPYLDGSDISAFRMDAGRVVQGAYELGLSTSTEFYGGRLVIYDTNGPDSDGDGTPDHCDDAFQAICSPAVANSSGHAAELRLVGSPILQDGDLRLHAQRLPIQEPGYFLVANQSGFVANPAGSQGNLCLGGTIARFQAQIQSSGTSGELQLRLDAHTLPAPLGVITSGSQFTFQAWFRDHNPNPTSNFTDAVVASFL